MNRCRHCKSVRRSMLKDDAVTVLITRNRRRFVRASDKSPTKTSQSQAAFAQTPCSAAQQSPTRSPIHDGVFDSAGFLPGAGGVRPSPSRFVMTAHTSPCRHPKTTPPDTDACRASGSAAHSVDLQTELLYLHTFHPSTFQD